MGVQLKTVGEIFSETWELYKERSIPILLVGLITICLVFLFFFLTSLAALFFQGGVSSFVEAVQTKQFAPSAIAAVVTGFLGFLVLLVWGQAATLAISVDESMSVPEALKAGWSYFFPLGWVGSLYLGILFSGLTLFIVPGLVLGLSMSFCFYALIEDDYTGMDAIVASHVYVRGHWWNTFLKLFLVFLLSFSLGVVPVVGQLLSFVFTPFFLLYMVTVYRDLREASDAIPFQTSKRWVWWCMAVFGTLLPLLAILGAAVTLVPQLPRVLEEIQQGKVPGIELPHLDGFDFSGQGGKKRMRTPPRLTRLPSVEGFWIWHDPAGDTKNPLLDIREVAAKGENGILYFRITMASFFDAYFKTVKDADYYPLISLYLDIDVDRRTGGRVITASERSGYDFALNVLLGSENASKKHIVKVTLYQMDSDHQKSLGDLAPQSVIVSGRTLSLQIPAARFGVHSEDMMRMCFLEYGQQQGSGLAKDKLIPLK